MEWRDVGNVTVLDPTLQNTEANMPNQVVPCRWNTINFSFHCLVMMLSHSHSTHPT